MSVKVPSCPSHLSVEVEATGLFLLSWRCFTSHPNSYQKKQKKPTHIHTPVTTIRLPPPCWAQTRSDQNPTQLHQKYPPNNRRKGVSLKEDREEKVPTATMEDPDNKRKNWIVVPCIGDFSERRASTSGQDSLKKSLMSPTTHMLVGLEKEDPQWTVRVMTHMGFPLLA